MSGLKVSGFPLWLVLLSWSCQASNQLLILPLIPGKGNESMVYTLELRIRSTALGEKGKRMIFFFSFASSRILSKMVWLNGEKINFARESNDKDL